MRLTPLVLTALTLGLGQAAHAQRDPGRWSLGIHGGADVTDNHTLKLLGAQIGYGVSRSIRVQFAVTSVIEEPGNQIFFGTGAQWTLPRGRLRPFLGGGLGVQYAEVGPFSNTDWGLLGQGGFKVVFRNLTPYAELRILGFTGTTTQILVGFESRAY
jgi:hypothetical protein